MWSSIFGVSGQFFCPRPPPPEYFKYNMKLWKLFTAKPFYLFNLFKLVRIKIPFFLFFSKIDLLSYISSNWILYNSPHRVTFTREETNFEIIFHLIIVCSLTLIVYRKLVVWFTNDPKTKNPTDLLG